MKKFSIILAAVLLGLIVSRARAVGTYWQAGTGNWSTGGNWDNGEPSGSNSAYINNGGTAQITQPGEACSVLFLGMSSGDSGNGRTERRRSALD